MVLSKFYVVLNYLRDQGLNGGKYYVNLHISALWGKGQVKVIVLPAFWKLKICISLSPYTIQI